MPKSGAIQSSSLISSNALLRAISRAQAQLNGHPKPTRQLFEALLDDLIALTRSKCGFIAEVHYDSEDHPHVELAAHKGIMADKLAELYGEVLNSKTAVTLHGAKGHPGMKHFFASPVVFGTDLVGVIGVANCPQGYPASSAADLAPLLGIYGQIIHAYRTEQLIQQSSQGFTVLKQYLEATAKLGLEEIAPATLAFLQQQLDIPHSSILLVEAETNRLAVAAINSRHIPATEMDGHLLADDALWMQMIHERKPLYRADIGAGPRGAIDHRLLQAGLQSDFYLPLCGEDECLGILHIATENQQGLSGRVRQLVTLLSPSLAQAMLNHRLLDSATRNEAKYRRLVEALQDHYFFYTRDTKGVFTYLSPSIHNMLGYSPQEYLRHYSSFHTDNPINEQVRQYTELSTRGVQQPPYAVEVRAKDGRPHTLEISELPVFDDDGEVIAVEGIAQDITARQRADQLIDKQMRHLNAIDRINQHCLKTDLDAMLHGVLHEMLEIFGCDRAWLMTAGSGTAGYWHAPYEDTATHWPGIHANGGQMVLTPEVEQALEAAMNSDAAIVYDPESQRPLPQIARRYSVQSQMLIALRIKGRAPWLLGIHHCVQAYVFTQPEKRIFYDIAQRLGDALSSLLTLRDLRKSQVELAEAQRIARLGNWSLDLSTHELTWSDEIYRIYQLDPQQVEASHETFLDTIHPEDRPVVEKTYRDSIRNKKPYDIVHRLLLKDGMVKYVHERGETQYAEDGTPLRSLGTVQDVTDRTLTEQALKRSEDRWRSITNFSPDHILLLDRDGRIVFINHTLPPLTREEVIGSSIYDYMLEAFKPAAMASHRKVLETGVPTRYETSYIDSEGQLHHFEANVAPIRGADKHEALILSARDITERKRAEERARQFAAVVENTVEGVLITDRHNRIIAVNRAFSEITGYTEQEVLSKTPNLLKSQKHEPAFYHAMWQALHDTDLWQGEVWDRRKDGEIFPAWSTISVVRNEAGALTNYVSVFSDISTLKSSQERLDFLAYHDPLTKLPNRLLFSDRLDHALNRAQREDGQVAVLFLDLDRFKNINDSLGHPIGDALLQQVAERLTVLLRKEDTVARLGGDEFIILIEDLNQPQSVASLAQKIIGAFLPPVHIDGHELHVTVSIGISVYPRDGSDSATLIKNADAAMYRAKEFGRNNYQFYTEALTSAAFERLTLETALRQALIKEQFILHYQPLYDIETAALVGCEALIRWQHPDLGLVQPARFIPLAEESGLIDQLGTWVLFAACAQMQQWRRTSSALARITVNVSGQQLHRGDMAAIIQKTLSQTGLPARFLELEVTEGVIMEETHQSFKALDDIKQLGVTIAIDDFGTGYSSLSRLKRLPVDKLKIDKSFVRDISTDANDEAIARAVVALAQSLQLKVVAEGVETAAQLAFLKRLGCDEAQGYYYGAPHTAAEFEQLLQGSHRTEP